MVWLSFYSPLRTRVESLKGVVPPFFGSVAIIFGLLVAFLSNDIWERNKQAERVILTESDTLIALHSLGIASGTDTKTLRASIRDYASAVVEDEWPRLQAQERSGRASGQATAAGCRTPDLHPGRGFPARHARHSRGAVRASGVRSSRPDSRGAAAGAGVMHRKAHPMKT
jgi:hypothetical protein